MKRSRTHFGSLFVSLLLAWICFSAAGCDDSSCSLPLGDFDAEDLTGDPDEAAPSDGEEEEDEERFEEEEVLSDDEPEDVEEEEADATESTDSDSIDDETEIEPEPDFETPEPDSCTPGSRECYGNKLKTCNDRGDGYIRELCAEGTICLDGGCREILCEAGERRCLYGQLYDCGVSGTAWVSSEVCLPGETCTLSGCESSCESAREILLGTPVQGDTRESGNSVQALSNCWGVDGQRIFTGRDALFALSLTAGQTVRIEVTPTSRHFDPALYLVEDCGRAVPECLGGADSNAADLGEAFLFTAPENRTYYVVVDSWEGVGGTFDLQASEQPDAPFADLFVAEVTHQFNVEFDLLNFYVTVGNRGSTAAELIQLGFYLEGEPGTEADLVPTKQMVLDRLETGAVRQMTFHFPHPARGAYRPWAVIDWPSRRFDPTRNDNGLGENAFNLTDPIHTETMLSPPIVFTDRIMQEGEVHLYRVRCHHAKQTLLLEATANEGASVVDLRVVRYKEDDSTVAQDVDQTGPADAERLWWTCAQPGSVRIRVEASSNAPLQARTGGFTVLASPLSGLDVKPETLRIHPLHSRRVLAYGRFTPLIADGRFDMTSLLNFSVLDPSLLWIGDEGDIQTFLDSSQSALTYLFASTLDPAVPITLVPVEITDLFPPMVYLPDESMPISIGDSGADPTIVRVPIADSFWVKEIMVGLSLSHPDLHELTVRLVSPTGTVAGLADETLSGTLFVSVFGMQESPSDPYGLLKMIGENAQGEWRIEIQDNLPAQTGRINAVQLFFDGVMTER